MKCCWLSVISVCILCFCTFQVVGQSVESDERALLYVDDGLSFSKDSMFLMNLRFRMQNRAGFNTLGGDDFEVNDFEMRVRRMRLRLDGYVLNPRFQYYVQLAFSRADMDLESGFIAQPLRDAILYYVVNDKFYIGFGQSKLPGNRQRVVSSGNLQFADRSIANGIFTLDRDFGFFGYYTETFKNQSILQLKGAITSGDGRNAISVNNGLAYTGRIEYLPLGRFSNNGDYSEGDLEFEPKPKFSIAMTYSINQKAVRTGGQLGPMLFDERDMDTWIIDGVYKHLGWAISGEYLKRTSSNPITANEAGDIRYVIVGDGMNFQVSKMLTRKSELAARYSNVIPSQSIQEIQERIDTALLGYTYYLNGHRIKIQANIGYKWLEGLSKFDNTGNSWSGMFQVEFGI